MKQYYGIVFYETMFLSNVVNPGVSRSTRPTHRAVHKQSSASHVRQSPLVVVPSEEKPDPIVEFMCPGSEVSPVVWGLVEERCFIGATDCNSLLDLFLLNSNYTIWPMFYHSWFWSIRFLRFDVT